MTMTDDELAQIERLNTLNTQQADRIERLVADLARYQTDIDQLYSTLNEAKDRTARDFETIAEMLLAEAVRRDWCNEYDDFVREVNANTTEVRLRTRRVSGKFAVTLDVEFMGEGSSNGRVCDAIQSFFYGQLDNDERFIENARDSYSVTSERFVVRNVAVSLTED